MMRVPKHSHADFLAYQAIQQGARWAEAPREDWQLAQMAALPAEDLMKEPGAILAVLKGLTDPDNLMTYAVWSDVILGVPEASSEWARWFVHGATIRVFRMLRAGGAQLIAPAAP